MTVPANTILILFRLIRNYMKCSSISIIDLKYQ